MNITYYLYDKTYRLDPDKAIVLESTTSINEARRIFYKVYNKQCVVVKEWRIERMNSRPVISRQILNL